MKTASKSKARPQANKKISRTKKPDDMNLEQWQTALRVEFGKAQRFKIKKKESTRSIPNFQ